MICSGKAWAGQEWTDPTGQAWDGDGGNAESWDSWVDGEPLDDGYGYAEQWDDETYQTDEHAELGKFADEWDDDAADPTQCNLHQHRVSEWLP